MFGVDTIYPISLKKLSDVDLEDFNKSFSYFSGNKVYIGRGSPLGNPYSSKPSKYDVTYVEELEEAVKRFESDLYGRRLPDFAYEAMGELIIHSKNNPLTLLCWCKDPNKCHGRVIREFILNKGKKDGTR